MGRTLLLGFLLLVSAGPALASPEAGSEPRIPGGRLFARVTAEKRDLVLQEVFEFTLSVYSRGLSLGREISLVNLEEPGLNFLPFEDLGSGHEATEAGSLDVHRFRGRGRAVATGTFRLQPTVRLSVVVPPGRTRAGGPAAGPGQAAVREADLQPAALTVHVRPLPEAGKPGAFAGAVGSFTFSAAVRPSAAVEGEPLTVTMEIQGRGNIESVPAPRVEGGDLFKVYEPKLIRKESAEGGSRGRLVFEQIIVPRSAAPTSVPAVTFGYFDPSRGAYRTLVGGPFPLSVTPSAHGGAVVVEAPPSGPAAKRLTLRKDIAPLKPEPRRWSAAPGRPWHASLWFPALQLLPPAVAIALFVAVRRREELLRDVAKARRHLAPEAAGSGMAAAEQAFRAGDPARFHEALWGALAAYFGNRMNLLPGEVSREAVIERLSRAGLDPGVLARLEEVFSLLERERFGRPPSRLGPPPATERHGMSRLLEEARRLLAACETVTL